MKIPDVQQAKRTVTVDASGDADVDIGPFRGYIDRIIYTKDDYAAGVDFTLTGKDTGRDLWVELNVDASKTVYPSEVVHDTAGVATSQRDRIWINGDVRVVIANGGVSTSGDFEIWAIAE